MYPSETDGSDGYPSGRQGNTKTCRVVASKNWFFTYNNPGSVAPEFLEEMEKKCEKYMYQLEQGENGTKHYQGCIELKTKGRPLETFSKYKKIHWEKTKNVTEAVKYCSKQESRIEGPWFKGWTPIKEKKPFRMMKEEDMKDWQKDLEKIVNEESDFRTIHVYIDETGNTGKSAMTRYLVHKYKALAVCGKAADMKCAIALRLKNEPDNEPNICILDLPRSVEHVSWGGLEEIKNGTFASSKYESGMVELNEPPHLIVFTNHEIIDGTYSQDRLRVTRL